MKNPLKSLFAALLAAILIAFVPLAAANLGDDDVAASDDPNFQEGRKALESQDWKKAVELLSKAVESDPKKLDRLWKSAADYLAKCGVDASTVEATVPPRNLKLLGEIAGAIMTGRPPPRARQKP